MRMASQLLVTDKLYATLPALSPKNLVTSDQCDIDIGHRSVMLRGAFKSLGVIESIESIKSCSFQPLI